MSNLWNINNNVKLTTISHTFKEANVGFVMVNNKVRSKLEDVWDAFMIKEVESGGLIKNHYIINIKKVSDAKIYKIDLLKMMRKIAIIKFTR